MSVNNIRFALSDARKAYRNTELWYEKIDPNDEDGPSYDDAITMALYDADMRMKGLEKIAREIIEAHEDVDSGADIPHHIYKMAKDALSK